MLNDDVFASCTHLLGSGYNAVHGGVYRISDIAGNINAGVVSRYAFEGIGAVAEAGGDHF
ncbi:hypothetical protein D3C73_1653630 [compost metagenome]